VGLSTFAAMLMLLALVSAVGLSGRQGAGDQEAGLQGTEEEAAEVDTRVSGGGAPAINAWFDTNVAMWSRADASPP
jgi:hypothetical protein